MGSKLTDTGVTFGSNLIEQTKPLKKVNTNDPNDAGEFTVDIGTTSTQINDLKSRTSTLETPHTWSLNGTQTTSYVLYARENNRKLVYFKGHFYCFAPARVQSSNQNNIINENNYARSDDLIYWSFHNPIHTSHTASNNTIVDWHHPGGLGPISSKQLQTTIYVFKNKMYRINMYGYIFSTSDGLIWTEHGENTTIKAGFSYLVGRASCVHENEVWLSGGMYNATTSGTHSIYKSSDGVTFTQHTSNYGGPKRGNAHMISMNGFLYIIGGSTVPNSQSHQTIDTTIVDNVWRYNPSTNSWLQVSTYVVNSTDTFYQYQGQKVANRFYIFSMRKIPDQETIPDVYSTSNFITWRKEFDPIWGEGYGGGITGTPGIFMSSALKNGKLYALGGYTSLSTLNYDDLRAWNSKTWTTTFGNLTWGDTQEFSMSSTNNSAVKNEIPNNCAMVGLGLQAFEDINQNYYVDLSPKIIIRYKLIS